MHNNMILNQKNIANHCVPDFGRDKLLRRCARPRVFSGASVKERLSEGVTAHQGSLVCVVPIDRLHRFNRFNRFDRLHHENPQRYTLNPQRSQPFFPNHFISGIFSVKNVSTPRYPPALQSQTKTPATFSRKGPHLSGAAHILHFLAGRFLRKHNQNALSIVTTGPLWQSFWWENDAARPHRLYLGPGGSCLAKAISF